MFDTLRIMTNFSCNQRCKFCYQEIWDENFITVGDIMEQLEKRGLHESKMYDTFKSVTILGGEPTLHPNILHLVDMFKNVYQMPQVRLNTNARAVISGKVSAYELAKNLDVLCLDVGLGQVSLKDDYATMKQKVQLARELLGEFEELTLKFNHVYSKHNQENIADYFNLFLELIEDLPKNRIMVNVYEDVMEQSTDRVSTLGFCENIGASREITWTKYFNGIEHRGFRIAYFAPQLYTNTQDFLFVWKGGSTTSFKEYLKLVAPKRNMLELTK